MFHCQKGRNDSFFLFRFPISSLSYHSYVWYAFQKWIHEMATTSPAYILINIFWARKKENKNKIIFRQFAFMLNSCPFSTAFARVSLTIFSYQIDWSPRYYSLKIISVPFYTWQRFIIKILMANFSPELIAF